MERLDVSDHTCRGDNRSLRQLRGLGLRAGQDIVTSGHPRVGGNGDEVGPGNC